MSVARLRFAAFFFVFACAAPATSERAAGPRGHCQAFEAPPAVTATDNDTSATAAPIGCVPRTDAGLTYEIYVRSFQDTDDDGIGDLEGVRMHLDYLDRLGVRTLWLMPIFSSGGVAGYDVTDFDQVKPDYGNDDALAALLADAHARGMRVLLDIPFNHTSRSHPWFTAAEADPDSPSRELYVFSDEQWDTYRWFPAAGGGWYYAMFGAPLPDLDWTDTETRSRMFDVFGQWLDAGVDGYRLDAVPSLIEEDGEIRGTDATHALLAELYAAARADHPDTLFLSEASDEEVAENLAYLGTADAPEADRVLDFPRHAAMLEAVAAADPAPLLDTLLAQQDAGHLGHTAPFLSSHDLTRLPATVPDPAARRMLEVVELLLPGDPVLYYGEELDLADATTDTGQDYAWRAPMAWDHTRNGGFTPITAWFTPDPGYLTGRDVADQEADPQSPLRLIEDLACVRDELADADWEPVETDTESVFAFSRGTDEGRVVVVANLGGAPTGPVRVDRHGGFRDLTDGGAQVLAEDGLALQGLGAWEYRVFADTVAARCTVAPAS